MQRLDGALSPAEKEKAAYEKELRAALKAIPTQIPLQYASIASPPAPKAVSSYIQEAAGSSSDKPKQVERTEVSESADYKLCEDSEADFKARGEACNKIIEAGKGSPAEMAEAYFGRGWMNDKQNRDDEAIADYSQALKLDPSLTAPRNNRGTKYLDAKKYDEALRDFEIILKDEPTQKYALSNKAEALRRKGQLSEALSTVKKALDVDAAFKWARTVEARILADMKKQEGGDTSSKKAPAAGADDPPSASSKEVVALRERAGSHLAN